MDGLGLMRSLASDLPGYLSPGGLWVFQIGDSQWEAWAAYLERSGYETIAPEGRRPGGGIVGAARWKGTR
jgi:methylase of polypeptide subunit release factors